MYRSITKCTRRCWCSLFIRKGQGILLYLTPGQIRPSWRQWRKKYSQDGALLARIEHLSVSQLDSNKHTNVLPSASVTATYFYGKGKVDADMQRGQDAWFTFSSVVCLPDVIFGDIAKALRISFYAAQLRYREVQQAFTLELNRFICCLIGVVFKIGRDLLNYTQNTSISGVKSSWYTLYKYISFIHPPLTWVQLSIENFMGIWKLVS